jgi:plastocyanin
MHTRLFAGTVLIFAAWGCGDSGGYDSTSMTMSSPTMDATPATSMVNIVGQQDALSFSPNPAPISPGSFVVWHNMDATAHHIVMNDGSFDSGTIAPGGSSQAMRLGSAGGNYHCTIHPTTMFGSINVATLGQSPSPGY